MDLELYGRDHYLAALSGALPALALMAYFDWLDRRRPEPRRLRYGVTLLGVLSVVPTVIVGLALEPLTPPVDTYDGAAAHAFGLAAAVEETFKFLAVVLVVWRAREFDERMDGLVYGARAGLGFALVENCLYIWQAAIDGQLVVVWILRAVLAVPGHAVWSAILGYAAARRRLDRAGPGLLGGWVLAVGLHGLYDAAIFLTIPLRHDGHEALATVLLLGPLVISVLGWRLVRRMAREALQLDDAAELARRPRASA